MREKIVPNEFEFRILCFQHNYITPSLLIKIFLDTEVYLPSASADKDTPLLMLPGDEKANRVVIFTSIELLYFAALTFKSLDEIPIKSYYPLLGREVLYNLPKKHGLTVNPGFNISFTMPAKLARSVLKNLKKYDMMPKPF